MSIHKELLLEIIHDWNDTQLENYIHKQEERLEETRLLLRELRALRAKRNKKQTLYTGERHGT